MLHYLQIDNEVYKKNFCKVGKNAKIIIIAYESLTCGHCADFHKNIYPDIKKEFIDKGLVKNRI